jgi:hypothetical protein
MSALRLIRLPVLNFRGPFSVSSIITLPALPAEATDPEFRQFYGYWVQCAPPGLLPGRQHLDPLDMPNLLHGLMLYDVVEHGAGLRFRVRVAGQTLVDMLGASPKGHFIDEFVIEQRKADVNAALTAVARERIAHYWENRLWTAGLEYITMQRLALPLARDGLHPDMVIAHYVRVQRRPDGGDAPPARQDS